MVLTADWRFNSCYLLTILLLFGINIGINNRDQPLNLKTDD